MALDNDDQQEGSSSDDPTIQILPHDDDSPLIGNDVQPNTCLLCDPRAPYHRYTVLPLICLISFGSYFCYDGPAALQGQILGDLSLTMQQYSYLYSWYSWPNVILSMVGGLLTDKWLGVRLATVVFALLVCVGQVLFASGACLHSLWLMVLGRFVFGIGGESLCVAVNTYCVLWFRDRELNLVLALSLSAARAGSTANFNLMPYIYSLAASVTTYARVGLALHLAGVFALLSLLLAVIMWVLDRNAERILQRRSPQEAGEAMRLADVRHFGISFWLLTFVCVFYYSAVFPFVSFGQQYLVDRFSLSVAQADSCIGVIYIISLVVAPLFGLLIDLYGRNIIWLIASIAVSIVCHVMLAFTHLTPWLAISLLGVAFSLLAACLWPMVPMLVPENYCATAYGVLQSAQNLGLALVNLLCGYIVQKYGYATNQLVFVEFFVMALACSVLMFLFDLHSGGSLNLARSRQTT